MRISVGFGSDQHLSSSGELDVWKSNLNSPLLDEISSALIISIQSQSWDSTRPPGLSTTAPRRTSWNPKNSLLVYKYSRVQYCNSLALAFKVRRHISLGHEESKTTNLINNLVSLNYESPVPCRITSALVRLISDDVFFFFFLFLGVFTRNGHEKVTILSFAISVMQVPMCSAYFFLSFSKKRKRTRTWHRAEKTTVNVFELNNHDNICRSKLNQVPLKATEPTGEWLTPKAWLLARELWHLAEILVSMSQMPCQTSGVPYSTVQYLGGR